MAVERLSKYNAIFYGAAVLAAAALYAYFAGFWVTLIDTAIWYNALLCACTLGCAVCFLHRMSRYGMPAYVQFILWIVWNIGAEVAVMNILLAAGEFAVYRDSLGLRVFLQGLYALIFLLWNARSARSENPEEARQEAPREPAAASEAASVTPMDRVSVRTGDTLKIIPCTDLLYLKAEGDYVNLVTGEGRWLKEQTLKSFQESLPGTQFVRVHRSYLVNVTAISRIERYGEQHLILLKNGEHIQISTAGYKALRSVLHL